MGEVTEGLFKKLVGLDNGVRIGGNGFAAVTTGLHSLLENLQELGHNESVSQTPPPKAVA